MIRWWIVLLPLVVALGTFLVELPQKPCPTLKLEIERSVAAGRERGSRALPLEDQKTMKTWRAQCLPED